MFYYDIISALVKLIREEGNGKTTGLEKGA